jgi:hypothetical protein
LRSLTTGFLDSTYGIPSQENVKAYIVSEEELFKREKPLMLSEKKSKPA